MLSSAGRANKKCACEFCANVRRHGSAAPSSQAPKTSPPEKLTVGGKFRYFANESFRPGVWAVAAVYTGIEMAYPPKAYPREWRQGIAGFGRNYGDFMASWAAVQGGKFVVATATHEDPRYIRSTRSGLLPRSLHALRFVFVDQSDSGHNRLALANFAARPRVVSSATPICLTGITMRRTHIAAAR